MTEKYKPTLRNTQIFTLFVILFNRQILTWSVTNIFSSSRQVTAIGRVKCSKTHKEVVTGEKTVDARGCSARSMKEKGLKGNSPSDITLHWIVW